MTWTRPPCFPWHDEKEKKPPKSPKRVLIFPRPHIIFLLALLWQEC